MKRIYGAVAFGLALGLVTAAFAAPAPASASWNPNANSQENSPVRFSMLFLDGEVYRTNLPPSELGEGEGLDPLFSFTNGIEGQRSVAAVGPGTGDYHGGQWAVYEVTWLVDEADRTVVKSAADIMELKDMGKVEVTRNGARDFLCPIQPGKATGQQ
jgi:hypothetical protein